MDKNQYIQLKLAQKIGEQELKIRELEFSVLLLQEKLKEAEAGINQGSNEE